MQEIDMHKDLYFFWSLTMKLLITYKHALTVTKRLLHSLLNILSLSTRWFIKAAASPTQRVHIIIEMSRMQTPWWLHTYTVYKHDPFHSELGLCNYLYRRISVAKASLEGVYSCISPGVTVQDGQSCKAVVFHNIGLKYLIFSTSESSAV